MRYFATVLIFTLALAGCSDPKDIVFGPEPLKQISEQGAQFKKLPEEDRSLLVSYLALLELDKEFGGEMKSATGRTVGEVLKDARVAKKENDAAKAEAAKMAVETEALKAKVLAERKAVLAKMSSSATVAIVDKEVLPKDYEVDRYSEMLVLTYAIQNKSDKTILQLKGRVDFNDATGDEIGWLTVNIDEPVKAGDSITTTTSRGWKLNPIMNGEIEKIAGREFSSMTTKFTPESIAFEGGDVLRAPEVE